MGCCALLTEVLGWRMLEAEVMEPEVLELEMIDFEAAGSEVMMMVVGKFEEREAKEVMATKETCLRNDDRWSEAARLRGLGQQDAQSGSEQILVVGR